MTIDPNAPNHTSVIGSLAFGAANGFRGLAYDTQNDKLYASSPFVDGIYEVETGPCSPLCDLTQQAGLGLNRFDASLAWSPDTGMLHLVGWQLGAAPLGPRTLYDVVDPTTFEPPRDPIQVDAFTTSALAAVPEPASALALLAGAAGLLALQRRRRRS